MEKLKNKVSYITGGSQGIGLGTAAALLKKGMKVAISGRTPSKLEEAKNTLNAGDNLLILTSDVRKMEDETKAVGEILNKWGQLDVLVANAGIGHYADIADLTKEQWDESMKAHIIRVFLSVKAWLLDC